MYCSVFLEENHAQDLKEDHKR
uniref:Uncharacterized protein n=1 Tax=Arundo donax TaxID=35708 RepID=A0A0A9H4U4_ARUDO